MISTKLESGSKFLEPKRVFLNVNHHRNIDLLFIWIELWLKLHCKSPWHLELLNQLTLQIDFQDQKEAIYFKLGSEYYLTNRESLQFIY